ncbi:MAG: hypothetical protein V1799_05810 [bacterium]
MNYFERFYKHKKFFDFLDELKIKQRHWIILSILVASADFLSGNKIQFSILYLLPIALAAWFGERREALILALLLPCSRLIFRAQWDMPWFVLDSMINLLIRILVFIIIAYLISFIKELHVLRGLLHICSYCNRIKNEDGTWISVQEYIVDHSEALLSHGICLECGSKHFSRLFPNK